MSFTTDMKVRAASLLGFSANDIYLLKSIQHRRWILRTFFGNRLNIPVQPLEVLAPAPVNEQDVLLCQRLIEAYRRARAISDDRLQVSSMWQQNLETLQSQLRTCLEIGEAPQLAELMSRFLATPVVRGIDTGDLYTGKNWKVQSLKALDDLASLAEQLGVVRTESGQGETAYPPERIVSAVDVDRNVRFPPLPDIRTAVP
jgi:glycine/D-amino acid oxidase-like deaminating enzyme